MLPAPTPQVVVVNESTKADQGWAWNLAWALGYYARWQFAPIWKSSCDVSLLEKGKSVPAGAWVLHLIDDITDAPEALGYHDEDGKRVPYARVGIETALKNGCQPSEVAAHELAEMLVDPHVNATSFDPTSKRLYAMEVGDPVQGGSYDLGAPYGRTTGWIMADFVTADWFDPNCPPLVQTDYRGIVRGPFALGHEGYVSYATTLPPSWQQEMGRDAKKGVLDSDDRLARRISGYEAAPAGASSTLG